MCYSCSDVQTLALYRNGKEQCGLYGTQIRCYASAIGIYIWYVKLKRTFSNEPKASIRYDNCTVSA